MFTLKGMHIPYLFFDKKGRVVSNLKYLDLPYYGEGLDFSDCSQGRKELMALYMLLSEKTIFLSVKQMIHIKYQDLFSLKMEKDP